MCIYGTQNSMVALKSIDKLTLPKTDGEAIFSYNIIWGNYHSFYTEKKKKCMRLKIEHSIVFVTQNLKLVFDVT